MAKRPLKPRRGPSERSALLGDVGYEVWMCAEATLLLAKHGGVMDRIGNAYLECQLLHARCSIEFVVRLKKDPWPNDVLRTEFFRKGNADWDWKALPEAVRLEAAWVPLCNHLAHLTWARTEASPAWDYPEIGDDVLSVARAWRQHQQARGLRTNSDVMFTRLQRAGEALKEARLSFRLPPGSVVTAVTTGSF